MPIHNVCGINDSQRIFIFFFSIFEFKWNVLNHINLGFSIHWMFNMFESGFCLHSITYTPLVTKYIACLFYLCNNSTFFFLLFLFHILQFNFVWQNAAAISALWMYFCLQFAAYIGEKQTQFNILSKYIRWPKLYIFLSVK